MVLTLRRASRCPDSTKWAWADYDREGWNSLAYHHPLHRFLHLWRGRTFPAEIEFPYELDLGLDDVGEPLLSFNSTETLGGNLLVRQAYRILYERIVLNRDEKGAVVITGQPGIGAYVSLVSTIRTC